MNIPLKQARDRLAELLHRAEAGETVVITRHGKPVADLIAHQEKKTGINLEAMRAYKKANGIGRLVDFIPEDFDDPLPEDFLLKPLP